MVGSVTDARKRHIAACTPFHAGPDMVHSGLRHHLDRAVHPEKAMQKMGAL